MKSPSGEYAIQRVDDGNQLLTGEGGKGALGCKICFPVNESHGVRCVPPIRNKGLTGSTARAWGTVVDGCLQVNNCLPVATSQMATTPSFPREIIRCSSWVKAAMRTPLRWAS